MMEFLSYGFIQRALLTGGVLGVTCAVLGVFVVLRRMAFIGVGISHAALGGVAIGLLIGAPPVLAAGAFSIVVAWVILLVADLAFPALSISESAIHYVWIGAFLGFPLAPDHIAPMVCRLGPQAPAAGQPREHAVDPGLVHSLQA